MRNEKGLIGLCKRLLIIGPLVGLLYKYGKALSLGSWLAFTPMLLPSDRDNVACRSIILILHPFFFLGRQRWSGF